MDTNNYLKNAGLNPIQIESIKSIALESGLKSMFESEPSGASRYGGGSGAAAAPHARRERRPRAAGAASGLAASKYGKTANTASDDLAKQFGAIAKAADDERAAQDAKRLSDANNRKANSICLCCGEHYDEYQDVFPLENELVFKAQNDNEGIPFGSVSDADKDLLIRAKFDDDDSDVFDRQRMPNLYAYRFNICRDCYPTHHEAELNDAAAHGDKRCPMCGLTVAKSDGLKYQGKLIHRDCAEKVDEEFSGLDFNKGGVVANGDEQFNELDDAADFDIERKRSEGDTFDTPFNSDANVEHVVQDADIKREWVSAFDGSFMSRLSSAEEALLKNLYSLLLSKQYNYKGDDLDVAVETAFNDKQMVGREFVRLLNAIPVNLIDEELADTLESCLAIDAIPGNSPMALIIVNKLKEYHKNESVKAENAKAEKDASNGQSPNADLLSGSKTSRDRIKEIKANALRKMLDKRYDAAMNDVKNDLDIVLNEPRTMQAPDDDTVELVNVDDVDLDNVWDYNEGAPEEEEDAPEEEEEA